MKGSAPPSPTMHLGGLSIGLRTNIQDGITKDEALLLMRHRLGKVVAALESRLPFWVKLLTTAAGCWPIWATSWALGWADGVQGECSPPMERATRAGREMMDSKWATDSPRWAVADARMNIHLRDGSTTEDTRLGRLVEADPRTRSYPVRALSRQG